MSINLSVIIPARNASAFIGFCLDALSADKDDSTEIIVVDDASSDNTRNVVVGYPVELVQLAPHRGRGPARNQGAHRAQGELLLFIDADVVVKKGTCAAVQNFFRGNPDVGAMIGSYDDEPAHRGIVSQYRNLLHHFTHQRTAQSPLHFWTGLGAVRREVFWRVSGFDEGRWSQFMEDVEFGRRLVRAEIDIRLQAHIQATHLKPYSLSSMVRSDLFDRAIPWCRFLREFPQPRNRFVTSYRQIASSGFALAALGAPLLELASLPGLVFAAVCVPAFLAVNLNLWAFFVRKRGVRFLPAAIGLHLVHSATAGIGALASFWPERSTGAPGVKLRDPHATRGSDA